MYCTLINEYYTIYLQERKNLNKTITKVTQPQILNLEDELVLVVAARVCGKCPIPAELDEWGKVFLCYFALFYIFQLAYPPGLQTGLLLVQYMYIDKNVAAADLEQAKVMKSVKDLEKFIAKP